MRPQSPEKDLRHALTIKGILDDVIRHPWEDVTEVDEPKAQAVFEATAAVLVGLKTAFDHGEQGAR